jgi:hypothetical protein
VVASIAVAPGLAAIAAASAELRSVPARATSPFDGDVDESLPLFADDAWVLCRFAWEWCLWWWRWDFATAGAAPPSARTTTLAALPTAFIIEWLTVAFLPCRGGGHTEDRFNDAKVRRYSVRPT